MVFFSFSGVLFILFYKGLANLEARFHSFWHSVYYKEGKGANKTKIKDDEEMLSDEDEMVWDDDDEIVVEDDHFENPPKKRVFRPTKFSYKASLFSGFIVYILGLGAFVLQIAILRTIA